MGSPSRVWMLIRNLISSHVASVGKKISAIKNVPSSGKGFVSLCTSLQEWDPGVIISPRGWGILRALQPRPGDVPSSGKGMENPQIPPGRDVLPARTCCGILGVVCPECRRWELPIPHPPGMPRDIPVPIAAGAVWLELMKRWGLRTIFPNPGGLEQLRTGMVQG